MAPIGGEEQVLRQMADTCQRFRHESVSLAKFFYSGSGDINSLRRIDRYSESINRIIVSGKIMDLERENLLNIDRVGFTTCSRCRIVGHTKRNALCPGTER